MTLYARGEMATSATLPKTLKMRSGDLKMRSGDWGTIDHARAGVDQEREITFVPPTGSNLS